MANVSHARVFWELLETHIFGHGMRLQVLSYFIAHNNLVYLELHYLPSWEKILLQLCFVALSSLTFTITQTYPLSLSGVTSLEHCGKRPLVFNSHWSTLVWSLPKPTCDLLKDCRSTMSVIVGKGCCCSSCQGHGYTKHWLSRGIWKKLSLLVLRVLHSLS